MNLFKKILVPVDGSRFSLAAACLAQRLARVHGAELRLIHVLDQTVMDQLARFSNEDPAALRAKLRGEAQAFISDLHCLVHQETITVPEVIILEGVPHELILAEANRWGADLIVMGKLGRRGVAHILLGSVTERVLEFADIPVLVVK